MATATNRAPQKELFGHPVGLYILFFTEMWERFSYYGMRAILVLYLVSATTGGNAGLGWTGGEAIALYGWYTMLVYVASIPGGIIADKLLGQKKTVLWGGIILVAGHGILAVEEMWAFYTGLLLIIVGVGMLKPNISTMVGGLYKEGDIRRDKGFTIFYIGINLGAFLSSLIVGYVGENIGWHYGFGLAGIAMALGLIVYWWGQKYLINVGNLLSKVERSEGASLSNMFSELLKSPLQLVITSVLMIGSIYVLIAESIPFGLLFIFLTLVVALMLMVYKDLTTQVMKDRYVVMILSFLLVVVFWGAFEQAGGLMNIYAADKTDRTLSFSLPLIGNEVPATWFQSLNAMFIIIFGVIIANFWAKRKLKNKEASSIFKMSTGVIIMGLGFLFMAIAAKEYTAFESKSAMYWLVLAYLLHTIGELCSSPVALSFITKLAPVKYASLMMGVYFAATGLGNKMAGLIGEFSQGEPATVQLSTEGSDVANRLQLNDTILQNKNDFTFNGFVYLENNELAVTNMESETPVMGLIEFENENQKLEIVENLKEEGVTAQDPYHVMLNFRQEEDKVGYYGDFVIEEVQTQLEFRTFIGITIFTTIFGLIVIFMLKPLKRLTHGAEDNEREMLEQEQYEIADTERNRKNS
ncbi:peptide MFS transporter [Salegentibacter salegens]|uniref:Proton-dependent oligopeptide transporter, POT family n=1 Tax=Salegentibacter salegens TaxID=143223 RepID=A0A1M7N740_9FLAO|nr:peptide MFS transporter [Salegentibacter salegens]PRX45665.1 POT family proton-dependent oligopeptide transporter [Salegentibacter salegens]SHM99378.1 proton-dependent oligopeptide transporter, POT family [Salegentibacter salegens]